MGNRATCPVCGSYSSSVLYDIENGKNCSVCGCSNENLIEYQNILDKKELYLKNKISNNLMEKNENLIKENFYLKTKIQKIIEILGYDFDSPIINSLQEILKIIHKE